MKAGDNHTENARTADARRTDDPSGGDGESSYRVCYWNDNWECPKCGSRK
jgi:hypothetical protein